MLFLNAGIGTGGEANAKIPPLSEDGIELVFATNHVGHHLLYHLLEPLLFRSKTARVVLTSSAGSFQSFDYKVATDLETLNNVKVSTLRDNQKVYAQSKLMQVFFAQELTRRLEETKRHNVYVNAAHPGVVNTAIFEKARHLIPSILQNTFDYLRENMMWTPAEGALTLLYLGTATDELVSKDIRGKYYHPQSIQVKHPLTQGEEELQRKAWNFCDDLVKDFIVAEEEMKEEDVTEQKEHEQGAETIPEEVNESELA